MRRILPHKSGGLQQHLSEDAQSSPCCQRLHQGIGAKGVGRLPFQKFQDAPNALPLPADAAALAGLIVLGLGCWIYKKYNHRFLYYV